MARKTGCVSLVFAALAVVCVGCVDDTRLVELAREADRRQAEQNQALAQQSQAVVETARQLVQADATARQQLVAAQASLEEQLLGQRAELDRQRDALENERRAIASQRYRDPLLAQALVQLGSLAACILPIVVCWLVLCRRSPEVDATELQVLLVQELAAERRQLSAPLAAILPDSASDLPPQHPGT